MKYIVNNYSDGILFARLCIWRLIHTSVEPLSTSQLETIHVHVAIIIVL